MFPSKYCVAKAIAIAKPPNISTETRNHVHEIITDSQLHCSLADCIEVTIEIIVPINLFMAAFLKSLR